MTDPATITPGDRAARGHHVTLDTETTSLDEIDGKFWEAALIVEGHPNPLLDGEHHFLLPMIDVSDAHPDALRISGFHERVAEHRAAGMGLLANTAAVLASPVIGVRPGRATYVHEREVAQVVARCLNGAIVWGCRPEFDKSFLARWLRHWNESWAAHYHSQDVAQITAGRLGLTTTERPYSSDKLAAQLGVPAPTAEERHTALGDARWVRRWRDRLDETAHIVRTAHLAEATR